MARDPNVPVNLTLTTPVGPQTRSVATTQGISRVERLRYWRRAYDYGGGVVGDPTVVFDSSVTTFDSSTIRFDAA